MAQPYGAHLHRQRSVRSLHGYPRRRMSYFREEFADPPPNYEHARRGDPRQAPIRPDWDARVDGHFLSPRQEQRRRPMSEAERHARPASMYAGVVPGAVPGVVPGAVPGAIPGAFPGVVPGYGGSNVRGVADGAVPMEHQGHSTYDRYVPPGVPVRGVADGAVPMERQGPSIYDRYAPPGVLSEDDHVYDRRRYRDSGPADREGSYRRPVITVEPDFAPQHSAPPPPAYPEFPRWHNTVRERPPSSQEQHSSNVADWLAANTPHRAEADGFGQPGQESKTQASQGQTVPRPRRSPDARSQSSRDAACQTGSTPPPPVVEHPQPPNVESDKKTDGKENPISVNVHTSYGGCGINAASPPSFAADPPPPSPSAPAPALAPPAEAQPQREHRPRRESRRQRDSEHDNNPRTRRYSTCTRNRRNTGACAPQ